MVSKEQRDELRRLIADFAEAVQEYERGEITVDRLAKRELAAKDAAIVALPSLLDSLDSLNAEVARLREALEHVRNIAEQPGGDGLNLGVISGLATAALKEPT